MHRNTSKMEVFAMQSHVLPGLLLLSTLASAIALPTHVLSPSNTSISHFTPRIDPNTSLASVSDISPQGQVKHTVDNPTESIVPSLPEGSRIYPKDILSGEDAGHGRSPRSYLHTSSPESSYAPASDTILPPITQREQDSGSDIASNVEKPNLSEHRPAISRRILPEEIQPRNPGFGQMPPSPIFAAPNGFRFIMNMNWRNLNLHDPSARAFVASEVEPFLRAVGRTMVPEYGYWVGDSGFEWSVWPFHLDQPDGGYAQRVAIEAMIPSYRGQLPLMQAEIVALGKAWMQWAKTQLNVETSLYAVPDIRSAPAQAVGSHGVRYEELKSDHPSWVAPGYMPSTIGDQVEPNMVIICRGKDGFRMITRFPADIYFDIEQHANKIKWSKFLEPLAKALDKESMSFTRSMEGLEFAALSTRFTWYLSTVFWTYYFDRWVSIDLHWTPTQASFPALDRKESRDICMRVLVSYWNKLGFTVREEARYDEVMTVGRIPNMVRFQYRLGRFVRAR